MPIQICHISDPHFGSAHAADVWSTVAEHLRIVRPEFLVVTGDVADSPKRDFFDTGHKELDALQIPYMVVPGNHDRFTKGNKIGKWFGGLAGSAESFDQVFGRSVAAASQVAEFTLSDGGYQRRLRVVGIDSCRHADYFARGYVDTTDMESAKRALGGAKGTDLNIAMVHHHVLPVRALEEARRGLQTLASVTTLVNAGSLLESLSIADARLVLHGHEHMFNCAYYSSPTADHEATCVVGAASITGNDSIEGCNIGRAGYNYFELGHDGSITLEARRWTGGGFQPHFQTRLFSGGTVPQVDGSYSEDKLMKRLATASSVRMLVMRSESLFRRQAALLLRWIEAQAAPQGFQPGCCPDRERGYRARVNSICGDLLNSLVNFSCHGRVAKSHTSL